MKILLKRATYYFNDGIALGPLAREAEVDLTAMTDSSVRKLNAGVRTGVVEITEGADEFQVRVQALSEVKEEVAEVVTKVIETPTVEEIKEESVEVTEDVVQAEEEKVEEEIPAKKTTTARRKTTTK